MTVMASSARKTNGDLIADCAQLGYLNASDGVWDATYGLGTFWTVWKPDLLVASDLDPAKDPTGEGVDFTCSPFFDDTFDAVVLDPPYKLNGTPDVGLDERYGIHLATSREGRHALIRDGITEAARVLRPGGRLLLKCMDQVNGGKVRWQTIEFTLHAETVGFELVDMLLFPSYRPQPEGRAQQHARRNYSTLLVFRKAGR